MAIKRITISVPEQLASRIKEAAGSTPVSEWVTHVLEHHLGDAELDRLWEEFYQDVSPSRADVRRAQAMHARLTKGLARD